jgi:hypothetical protein
LGPYFVLPTLEPPTKLRDSYDRYDPPRNLTMRHTGLVLALAGLVLAGSAVGQEKKKKIDIPKVAPVVPPRQGESKTVELFDGKTLKGWEGYEKYWSVQDGVIVGKNMSAVPTSTYLLTKEKFSDFRVIFEFKLGDENETHSGLAFWGRVPPNTYKSEKDIEKAEAKYTYQGHLVMFPSGWGMYDLFRRNSLGDWGVSNKAGIEAGKGKQHDWNHIEILAQGNRIRVAANGKAIVDWRDQKPEYIQEAPIGLQLHSSPKAQTVEWKNFKMETFPREDRLITVK